MAAKKKSKPKPRPKTVKAKAPPEKKAAKPKKRSAQRASLFVEAYIANGGNATEAAIAVGYSPRSAGNQGGRMMKNDEVRAGIETRQSELRSQFKLTTENVLRNMAQALFFDPRKLYNEDGSLKRVIDLDEDTAMALAGLEVVEMEGGMAVGGEGGVQHVPMYTKKLKWLDKNAAREQANKHLGHYERDNEQLANAVARVFKIPAKSLGRA